MTNSLSISNSIPAISEKNNCENDNLFNYSIQFYNKNSNIKKLTDTEQSILAAYYLQSLYGEYDESKLTPIGFFNFTGKERRYHWQQIKDISIEDARKKFCSLLQNQFKEYDSYFKSVKKTQESTEKSINISLPKLSYSSEIEEFKKLCIKPPLNVPAGNIRNIKYSTIGNSYIIFIILDGIIHWIIITDDYDIGMRIMFEMNFEETEHPKQISVELLKPQRCSTHKMAHIGYHHYSCSGFYNIILDNTFSFLRSKTVYLKVNFTSQC
ncbi:hypothetical protein HZS_4336 [Henneguya salminicola]|nr:hypothetical protein HZS_4336 [Henneguya salminicola]